MMVLKKPTAACLSKGLLSALSVGSSITSPCRPCRLQADALSRGRGFPRQLLRRYASVHNDMPNPERKVKASDQPSWPTSANPSPYEIFGLAKDAPYTKARFFQLAKLYHPDRHRHSSGDGISHRTKLERYRLVVAANEILSNPQKRRMYDLYGIGWDHQADARTRHRAADRAWRNEPGNASMNATWEDWERWYQQRDGTGEKQEPIFTSNGGFAGIIALFLIIGTWGQVTRAGTNSMNLLDMRDQRQAAISEELRRRQSEAAGRDRESRVESFLRQRELEKWAYDPPGHGVPLDAGASNK
ncbi:hypothetical protein VTK56DRAFT_3582 [Thermocarpiscus australiensis]